MYNMSLYINYGLFNCAVSILDRILAWWANNKLARVWKEAVVTSVVPYPRTVWRHWQKHEKTDDGIRDGIGIGCLQNAG